MPLLFRADTRSLIALAICLISLLLPFLWELSQLQIVLFILWNTLLCFIVNIINHNHQHLPVFHSGFYNFLLNILISLAKGTTASTVIVPHNQNHHVYANSEKDWIRTRFAGNGMGWLRLLRYIAYSIWTMNTQRRKPEAPHLSGKIKTSHLIERWSLIIFCMVLLSVDAGVTLICVWLPWAMANIMLVGVILLQHDDLESQRQWVSSRDFIGKLENYLFFNNGYHTVHHLNPTLHWSELPKEHAKLKKTVSSKLVEERSVLGYLFSSYLLAGSR